MDPPYLQGDGGGTQFHLSSLPATKRENGSPQMEISSRNPPSPIPFLRDPLGICLATRFFFGRGAPFRAEGPKPVQWPQPCTQGRYLAVESHPAAQKNCRKMGGGSFALSFLFIFLQLALMHEKRLGYVFVLEPLVGWVEQKHKRNTQQFGGSTPTRMLGWSKPRKKARSGACGMRLPLVD